MEFHWNTIGIPPPILSKFTACFPELFQWNTTHFLAERTGILMEFSWYFDEILVVFSRIWVVFWWNFSGILMEFQSKKQCKRSYLQNLTGNFAEFFMYFLILLYPKRTWKKPCTVGTLLVFWWKFHSTWIANKNACQKKPNYINEKHYIIIIFS